MVAGARKGRNRLLSYFLLFLVTGLLTLSTTLVSCKAPLTQGQTSPNDIKVKVVKMGYQSSGDILKVKGVLEKRLNPLGISVTWSKFAAGPQLLEAMNVGSVDVGSVGETPPIFGQAAGIDLVYIASTKPGNGEGNAIVVHKDSSINSVADLKGKQLAFQRATAQQYFVVRALQEVGLKLSDIGHVNLTPLDTREAFIRKSVDAAVVGDPHLAVYQQTLGVRILRNAKGLATQGGFYLASRKFATENPQLIKMILEEINKVGQWAEDNPHQVAELISPEVKIDVPTLEMVSKRRRYTLRPISDEVMSGQQQIADLFYENKFISKKIDIKNATLTPEQYAELTPSEVKP